MIPPERFAIHHGFGVPFLLFVGSWLGPCEGGSRPPFAYSRFPVSECRSFHPSGDPMTLQSSVLLVGDIVLCHLGPFNSSTLIDDLDRRGPSNFSSCLRRILLTDGPDLSSPLPSFLWTWREFSLTFVPLPCRSSVDFTRCHLLPDGPHRSGFYSLLWWNLSTPHWVGTFFVGRDVCLLWLLVSVTVHSARESLWPPTRVPQPFCVR